MKEDFKKQESKTLTFKDYLGVKLWMQENEKKLIASQKDKSDTDIRISLVCGFIWIVTIIY